MTNVTSHHDAPLGLPGGPVIPAGKTVFVDKWSFIKDHHVVQAWLKAGVISAEDAEDEPVEPGTDDASENPPVNPAADAENVQKDELIRKLAELGIKRNRRYSVENLQEQLDAALAAPSGDESATGGTSETGKEGE